MIAEPAGCFKSGCDRSAHSAMETSTDAENKIMVFYSEVFFYIHLIRSIAL